jgi:acylphosphatase
VTTAISAAEIAVQGRVQGVGYRYFVQREAEARGVTGFVRNLPDGSVELVAEADEPVIVDLEAQLRHGPSFARVASVERAPIGPRGDHGFHIR